MNSRFFSGLHLQALLCLIVATPCVAQVPAESISSSVAEPMKASNVFSGLLPERIQTHADVSAQIHTLDSLRPEEKKSKPRPEQIHYISFGVPIAYFNAKTPPGIHGTRTSPYERDVRASFFISYEYRISVAKGVFLGIGATCAGRGAAYRAKNDQIVVTTTQSNGSTSTSAGYDRWRYRLGCFETPLKVGLALTKPDARTKCHIITGVTPMFTVVSKLRSNYYVSKNASGELKEKWRNEDVNIAKPVLLAFHLGLEVSSYSVSLFARYSQPFSKVYKTSLPAYRDFQVNMVSFDLGMGIPIR